MERPRERSCRAPDLRNNNPWGSHGLCCSLCIHCASHNSSFNPCQAQPLENIPTPARQKSSICCVSGGASSRNSHPGNSQPASDRGNKKNKQKNPPKNTKTKNLTKTKTTKNSHTQKKNQNKPSWKGKGRNKKPHREVVLHVKTEPCENPS